MDGCCGTKVGGSSQNESQFRVPAISVIGFVATQCKLVAPIVNVARFARFPSHLLMFCTQGPFGRCHTKQLEIISENRSIRATIFAKWKRNSLLARPNPLTLRRWRKFARAIQQSSLCIRKHVRPGDERAMAQKASVCVNCFAVRQSIVNV